MKENQSITKKEMIAHAIAGVAQNLVYGLWGSYIMIFYTDVFGIAAGSVGLIMMLTRIWDAVNDPMMGIIADRTRSRWGRYRPWLLIMPLPVALLLIISFYTPDFTITGKTIYAAITYVALSMAFTAIDIPYWSLPSAMSKDSDQRASIFSFSRISTTLTTVATSIAIIPLVNVLGGEDKQKGFFYLAIGFAILAFILYMVGFKGIKEHVQPDTKSSFHISTVKDVLFKNKPLMLIVSSLLIAMSANGLRNSILAYYAQYNLNSLTLVSLLTALGIPGLFIGMVLTPKLSKRFGKKRVFIASGIYGAISNLIFFLVGYQNVTYVYVMFALSSVTYGFMLVLGSAMIADTIEYAEWKTGQRQEGLISSTQTFVSKLCLAISGGVIGLTLSMNHYIPNTIQSVEMMNTFHMMISLIPAIGYLLCIIPVSFSELSEKRHQEIVSELEERRDIHE